MAHSDSILVIDGDFESLQEMAGILAGAGYRVRTATEGALALASVRWRRPQLILLADGVRGMTGFDVIEQLKSTRARHVPVVFLLSRDDVAQQSESLRRGAVDFISKPFARAEVLCRVRTHLRLGRLRDSRHSSVQLGSEEEGWVHLAMQAGRMFAFEWNPVTDAVRRSHHFREFFGDNGGPPATGQGWFACIHAEDRDRFLKILALLHPAYDTYDVQYRVVPAEGQTVSLRESGRGFFDASGKLVRLIGMVADITEQKKAEQSLRRSEANLRQFIQKAPIAIAFVDEVGRIEYVNDRFVQTFGYQMEEIAEPDAWWQSAYPDENYRRDVIRFWNDCVEFAVRENQAIPPREYTVTCKDGTTRVVEIFGALLDRRKLVFFNDVTERKRAEAALAESESRFRSLADASPAGIFVLDSDGRLTFCNAYVLSLASRMKEALIGTRWLDLVHPDDRNSFQTNQKESVDTRCTRQLEYRLCCGPDQYHWVLSTGTPWYRSETRFEGYVGILIDITELKQHQEQLLATQKLESLGVLATAIAHDFNNLVASILADADHALLEISPNSPVRERLHRISALSIRAGEIVRQIMAFSGRETPGFESVDIARMVQEMMHLLNVPIPKGGSLKLDLPANLPLVRANSAQIGRVIMNLVLNAAEALGQRPGVVSIAARPVGIEPCDGAARTLAPGQYVRLQVSDTGSGMNESTRARIFDPFFTTKLNGRGLGLAAVQEIIRNHCGAIEVTSSPGEGATFEILLPCTDEVAQPLAKKPIQTARSVPLRSGYVLIVEDESTLRVAISGMLRKRGFLILEAGDGNAAVELLRSQSEKIAVILLDLTLPGKSSHEVFQEIRQILPRVPVIFTSALERHRATASLGGLREEQFLRKPYAFGELVKVLHESLSVGENAQRQSGSA